MPTCPLTLRLVKGSKLTFAELDQNFISLRNCINTVNSNFINYLPLSGGTLTGPLTACTSGIYINDLYSCNNDLTVWSNVTIEGNVTINGSATTINTEVIQAQDNVIILNYSGNSTTADGGGMIVVDAQGTGVPSSITVDSNGLWVFDPGFSASTATVDSLTACTGIWTSNLYGCSPITIHDNIQSIGSSATGTTSFAFGNNVKAYGNYSTASGYDNIASGGGSHAEGSQTTASNYGAHSEGKQTTASGYYTHSEGRQTTASGDYSHTEGINTTSSGIYSHAEGGNTKSIGGASHAEGYLTTSFGNNSHSEGNNTTSVGSYSHSEGDSAVTSGQSSHAEGQLTITVGDYSHAEGRTTVTLGDYSHAEGRLTTSIGGSSHSEGWLTTSFGFTSHAEGQSTIASGQSSHAEGFFTTSLGNYSHTEGIGTVTSGQYQHAQGMWNVTGDTTQGAFILGNGTDNLNRSNLIFAAGNEVNISGKTITTNFQMTSGGTNGYVLTSDASGNASWLPGGTNLGNILFVSNNGDDNTAVKGDLHRPYENIYTAKSAATTGDIIYVLPGTWVYDNRNSAGNPFNGQIETKVNLWKNGVSYYFLPGSKIVFYNQTSTGQVMYLFSPAGTIGETCKVYGELEWEGNSTGPDTSNGHSTFFWLDNSNDSGFTFHAEFKKLTSYANEVIRVSRNVTLSSSYPANITLIGDEIYRQYLGGQSGSAAAEFYNGSNAILNLISRVRKRSNINNFWYFQLNGNLSRSSVNIFGDTFYQTSTVRSFWLRSLTGTMNIDIKKMYHGTGHVFDTFGSGGWTLNLKGDVIDNVPNGSSVNGVFWITSGGNTINYDGNISTNIGTGNGRFIAGGTSNNTYNIKGDITYLGTGATTNVMFYPQNGGTVNYSGKITGNYAGAVAQTLNGTVNINNSYIKSTVQNPSSRLFFNGTTSQGYFRLNNSYVELKNNTNALSNGSYIDAFINNSIVINTGTGNTLSNTTNFGRLQVLNSTVTSSNVSTSIVSSGTAPVISSNSTVNTPYSITDLRGNITILTDLIY